MQTLRHEFLVTGTLVLLLMGLYGCSKSEHGGAAATHSGRPTIKKSSAASTPELANMVSAVGAAKAGAGVDLKFDLRGAPVVGEAVDIDIALIPLYELTQVYATFQGTDGLEITKGDKTPQIERPAVGVAITHTVTVIPRRDGVLYLSAVVLSDSASESVTRNFSIPVIVFSSLSTPSPADVNQAQGTAPAPAH
jgi:hypothetical protein